MREVKSSAIRGVEHNGKTLRVHFQSGGVYDYDDVTAEEVEALVNADSPGRHFRSNIQALKTGVRARDDELRIDLDDTPPVDPLDADLPIG